jgi:hypothetical protein
MQPQRIAAAFFMSDIACFLLQAGGATLMTPQVAMMQLGKTFVIAGIFLQLCFFTVFCMLTYHTAYGASFRLFEIPHLQPVFRVLFTTNALFFIRSVYRAAEYLDVDGYTGTNEWLFGLFETLAMFLCFAAYSCWHFGRLLPYTAAELAELVATRGASQPAPKASDVSNSELKLVPDLLYISRPLAKAADLPPTLP